MSSGRKTRSRMVDENIPNPGMTVAVSGISSLGAQTTLFSHYTPQSSSHVTMLLKNIFFGTSCTIFQGYKAAFLEDFFIFKGPGK